MNFDELKALFDELDLTKLLPEADTVLEVVHTVLRLSVMAGPLVLLGFGLLYLFAPPKEANHSLGYRFWWGMSSLDAWIFTQKVAGIGWSALGLVLTVFMAIKASGFVDLEIMEAAFLAGKYLLWQLVLTVCVCIVIDIVIVVCYDRRGFRRAFLEKN